MPFALYGLWRVIPAAAWPRGLLGTSFPVYLTHPFALSLLATACVACAGLGAAVATLPGYVAKIAAVVAVCTVGTVLLRRWCPRLAAVLFGGR